MPVKSPDEELDLVAELLEIGSLLMTTALPEVQIRSGRIEPSLTRSLRPLASFFPQFVFDDQLFAAPTDGLNGLLDGDMFDLRPWAPLLDCAGF